MANRRWTFAEVNYLRENWGIVKIKNIAKHLKRSTNAIKLKSQRLKLTDWRKYSEVEKDVISLNEFITNVLNLKNSYSGVADKLIKNGFKFEYIRTDNSEYKAVKMSYFLKWFKDHKTLLNLATTEDGCFDYGLKQEPDWIKLKLKIDKRAAEYGPHNRVWTAEEDKHLKLLLSDFKYGYREISKRLKRTEGAIKRRMLDLNIKARPLKADNHNKWTPMEKQKCKEMFLQGYPAILIAEEIDRSELAIKGQIERNNYYITE